MRILQFMNNKKSYAIDNIAKQAAIFDNNTQFEAPQQKYHTTIQVIATSTACAVETFDTCGILNFASYIIPGGFYLLGINTQEESLNTITPLCNVLRHKRFKKFYHRHFWHINYGLYHNEAIAYTLDGRTILTCAAPNYSACRTSFFWKRGIHEMNYQALLSRIKFVLNCFAQLGCKNLVLGAYGCGSFGQSPETVADIFYEQLNALFANVFESVVFAIPNKNSINFKTFFARFADQSL